MDEAPSRREPSANPPVAHGSLSTTPLAHLLVYVRNKRLTGALELSAPSDERRATVDLWRGRISDARTTPPVAYLGAVLYEMGFIDAKTLDASLLAVANEKKRHGEVLVASGAITALQRDQALIEQACRKVHHLFSFPDDTTFAFYEPARGPAVAAREPPIVLDPLAPVWRGIRDRRPEKNVRDVVAKYGRVPLRMVNEGAVDRVDLTAEERDLCDALALRPMTIAQLRGLGRVDAARVELLVYLLLIGKCIEPVAERATEPPPAFRTSSVPAPPSGQYARRPPSFRVPSASSIPAMPRASSLPPPAAAPADSGTVVSPADLGPSGLTARAAEAARQTPFEVLGLPDDAPAEAARASYFRLVRVWHPDRLPLELAASRADVEAIFAAMTRAFRTLTEPEARSAYLAARSTGRALERRTRAEIVRDVDRLLAKRDFAAAAAAAKSLHDTNIEDAEALALYAWAEAHGGEADEARLRASFAMLERAVNIDRFCERAYYYRGMIAKRLGNGAAALRDFMRVVQIDPKHVEAEREIRLHEMRTKKGSGEHSASGLAALFKRKK